MNMSDFIGPIKRSINFLVCSRVAFGAVECDAQDCA